MIYTVYYKHTFGADEIEAENMEEAKEKAIEILKAEDFADVSETEIKKGLPLANGEIAYSFEDFIECITDERVYNEDEEEEEEDY